MKKDSGWKLHFVAGALGVPWFVLGYLREVMQHDWELTAHQWLEALAWPAGWYISVIVTLFVIRTVKDLMEKE